MAVTIVADRSEFQRDLEGEGLQLGSSDCGTIMAWQVAVILSPARETEPVAGAHVEGMGVEISVGYARGRVLWQPSRPCD